MDIKSIRYENILFFLKNMCYNMIERNNRGEINMKKNIFITFFLLIVILGIQNVKADYECFYKATKNELGVKKDESDSFRVSTTNNNFEFDTFLGIPSSPVVADSKINNKWSEENLIKEYLKGCCPNRFYVCKGEIGIPGGSKTIGYFVILNGSLYSELEWQYGATNINGYVFGEDDCMIAEIDKDKTTVCTNNIEFGCELYDDSKEILEEKYCDFSSGNCDLNNVTEYNKEKEKLKSFCKTTLENSDFEINPCVNKCLGLQNFINELEQTTTPAGQCGFSQRLISWGLNIMKWIKYIVPVFVIIFGIFDFIKAIGADKEDEMKKSQKKFITRLIAAALIFIIPFILEFVLDKFGFTEYIDGCGLILKINLVRIRNKYKRKAL